VHTSALVRVPFLQGNIEKGAGAQGRTCSPPVCTVPFLWRTQGGTHSRRPNSSEMPHCTCITRACAMDEISRANGCPAAASVHVPARAGAQRRGSASAVPGGGGRGAGVAHLCHEARAHKQALGGARAGDPDSLPPCPPCIPRIFVHTRFHQAWCGKYCAWPVAQDSSA